MGLAEALGTIIAIVLIQIARDWRDGKSIFKRNGTAESLKTITEIRDKQNVLQHHFNHETTAILENINTNLGKVSDKLDRILIDGVRVKKE